MRGLRRGGLAGQVLPLVAIMISALVAMGSLAIDLSGAFGAATRQRQVAESAKNAVLADQLTLGFSDAAQPQDPWKDDVVRALSAEGYTGDYEIWVYEYGESRTGAADRVVGMTVRLSETYRTDLGAILGKPTFPVASSTSWWSNPSSEGKVWRPSGAASDTGRLYAGTMEGGTVKTSSSKAVDYASLPNGTKAALAEAMSNRAGAGS